MFERYQTDYWIYINNYNIRLFILHSITFLFYIQNKIVTSRRNILKTYFLDFQSIYDSWSVIKTFSSIFNVYRK